MRILWISPFLLHPTNTGGQIRSLGTLKQLHQRHEVHFATMQLEGQKEGVPRVSEYCSKAYFVPHRLPARSSLAFVPQFVGNFFSDLPLTVQRDVLPPMRALLAELRGREKFDAIVCDFLSAAVNLSDFSGG